MKDFLKARFEGVSKFHVRLDNVGFNSISGEDNAFLIVVVTKEEVKSVV